MSLPFTNVMPTMDQIDKMLSSATPIQLDPTVRHALTFACKIMDKYYLKTDVSNIYCIAMGASL